MKKRLLALLCLFSLLLAVLPAQAAEKGSIRLYFFDVPEVKEKTGDCSLIIFPNGQTMLVDAFTADAAPYVIEALRGMGIQRIDYLMNTHDHGDHIGGMPAFMDAFEIGAVYGSGLHVASNSGLMLLAVMEAKGLKENVLRRGDSFAVGEALIKVLHPEPATQSFVDEGFGLVPSDDVVNMQCLVFRVEYGDFSALYTGDIYDEAEFWLMDAYGEELHATLLKAPHHGSHTSSGARFLHTIRPRYAVAMGNVGVVGGKNKYLRAGAEEVYYTYMDGTVVFQSDGESVTVTAGKGVKP